MAHVILVPFYYTYFWVTVNNLKKSLMCSVITPQSVVSSYNTNADKGPNQQQPSLATYSKTAQNSNQHGIYPGMAYGHWRINFFSSTFKQLADPNGLATLAKNPLFASKSGVGWVARGQGLSDSFHFLLFR